MECLKNCCKNFLQKKKEPETPVITLRIPPRDADVSGRTVEGGRRGVTEDYLLSKLPPDGREVPFVLPTLKGCYIQPKTPQYPNLQSGLQSSARCTYAARKAELLGSGSTVPRGQMAEYLSPGSARRDTLMNRNCSPQSPAGCTLKLDVPQRLSTSMLDLTSSHSYKQRIESTSSTLSSSSSSMMGSMDSSLESITLSGEERELGRVCVRLSYQEAVEQVWITLVQCSDLNLHLDSVEPQRIGFKAIITVPKPIQFKSTTKEYSQDVSFMETFVFTLRLAQLRCSALVLRLQTLHPRKRTAAECVLSLRQLHPQETETWLHLSPPSKTSVCHAELHLTTCFQPVNGRVQIQVLAAQNLPASSSPLVHAYFVKVELLESGQSVMKKKKKTRALKASGGQCQWAETFHFLVAAADHAHSLSVKLYSRSSVRRKQCMGQVHLGLDSPAPDAVAQWEDTMAHPEKVVAAWHRLSSS